MMNNTIDREVDRDPDREPDQEIEYILTRKQLLELERATTPKSTKYMPHTPYPKQAAYLLLDCREAFYGGAAGGGKSDALLMCALQYVDTPGYAALLLRRSYADLTLPGALMDRARDWLAPFVLSKEVRWIDKEKTYLFPSGATITFGYLEAENDKYRYQSAEFQFIGFDELTQFSETQYRYLFSRLRRLKGVNIPIRMRSASNPDGDGIQWVYQRFVVEGKQRGRIFIPARMEDNPSLDQEEYEESLAELDPVTRMRLRWGLWKLDTGASLFKRQWFKTIDTHELPHQMRIVRYWDFASTDPKKQKLKNKDPDWSVGLLLGEHRGMYYILDVVRKRIRPEELEQVVGNTAKKDGHWVTVGIEEEPGSSGKIVLDHYARNVLKGYPVVANKETGSKVLRANPVSAVAERNNIILVRAPWNTLFLDELEVFPSAGAHDDQVDALSGAYKLLRTKVSLEAIPTEVGSQESYWGAM